MLQKGVTRWQSPSNIAMVKYWGKRPNQIPCNPSISMTLAKSVSETSLEFDQDQPFGIDFYFENVKAPQFADRIERYFDSIESFMPFIKDYHWTIHSSNTFPHSSGIASSASAMSAIAMGLCDIERMQGINQLDQDGFLNRASLLSRLGSGSASRSVFRGWSLWGSSGVHEDSSELYAIGLAEELGNSVFQNMKDAILIVSRDQKSVSSSKGHQLMETNPYASTRFETAKTNCEILWQAMKQNDLDRFGEIVESEALQLHALMMCSSPSFILMRPNTLQIIEQVRAFRRETKVPVYFTLDAGPNVHLIYPHSFASKVEPWIEHQLLDYCQDQFWIRDEIGSGPKKIEYI